MSRQRTEAEARVEEFDFLTAQGVDPIDAVVRAGWPTLYAAEIALRRLGHPKTRDLNKEIKRRQRAQTSPMHISKVIAEFIATITHRQLEDPNA
jgi:hypothetical protein